jgi:hypothetical protein
MTEEKANKKKRGRMFLFLPLKGFLPYVGLIAGILIIIFQQSFWSYSEGIVGRILIDIVRFETRGKYTIEYEKVRFNIWKDQLRLTNFSVIQDKDSSLSKEGKDEDFALKSSSLSLNVNSFFDVLINREIQIEGLNLVKPSLRIVRNKDLTNADTVQIESSKIIALVTKYLKDFKIKELKVENAKLEYIEQNGDSLFSVKLADVSLEINQFEVLNPLRQNETISSNHFEFELLNDSIDLFHNHLITFDKIKGSSRDSLIRVENLSIIPENRNTSNMKLDAKLLFAEIAGFDPRDIIIEDTLHLEKFSMGNGHIHLILPDSTKKSRMKTATDFPTILLGGMNLKNIDFNVDFPIENIEHNIGFKKLNIETSPITLNESSLTNASRLLSNVDVDLRAKEYTANLAGIEHKVKLDNVVLSVEQGYFSADGVEVIPYSTSGSRYKSRIRNMQMWGLDIHDAYTNQDLQARKILVRGLDLDVVADPKVQDIRLQIDYTNVYPLVRNIFQSIQVGDLQIRDSNILYKNLKNDSEIRFDNVSLVLKDILIDSLLVLNPKQILGAGDISLGGDGVSLNLKGGVNRFVTGPFVLSTISELLQVNDAQYTSTYPTYSRVESSKILATNVKWFELLHGKGLLVDTLSIDEPRITLDKLDTVYIPSHSIIYTSTPDFLDSLHVNYFTINDGELDVRDFNNTRINAREIAGNIDDIQVVKRDNKLYWLSYKFYGEIGPFSVRMNNHNHIITGNGTFISKSDSTLRLNQFNIRPLQTMESSDALFVSIPNIVITGIDLTHLLDSNLVVSSKATFINPNVDVQYFRKNNEEKLVITPPRESEEKMGKKGIRLFTDQISVINSSLSAKYDLEDQLTGHFKSDWIDFSIHGLHYTPETEINSDLSFFDHIELISGGLSHSGISGVDTFYIENLQLNSKDFISAQNIVSSGRSDQFSFDGTIQDLDFYSKRWLSNVLNKDFKFDSLLVSSPQVNLDIASTDSNSKVKGKPKNQSFAINRIILDSGTAQINTNGKIYHFPDINLDIDGFDVEKKRSELYSKSLLLNLKGLENIAPESNSTIDVAEINFSSKDGSLKILGLEIDPKFEKLEYGRELGYQTDWIHMISESIQFNGLDYTEYLDNGNVIINEGRINGMDLNMFRDKNIPFPTDQVRYMPQKILGDIEFPFTMKSLILNGINIRYEELAQDTSTPGYVDVLNLTAGISNITNDSLLLTQNSTLLIGANADFYNSGNLQADFEFDLSDIDGYHKYSAFLGEMPITDFNKLLEPTVNVLIKSGQVSEMIMHVEGNRDYVIGEMEFLYEDLHFNLIGKKTGTTSAMGPALGTFFANTFIVNRNNPRLLFARNGNIYFERDTTKSIINYLTKATLSGVVSSIGARNNRKDIRKANKEAKEKQDRKRKKKKRERTQNDQAITTKGD